MLPAQEQSRATGRPARGKPAADCYAARTPFSNVLDGWPLLAARTAWLLVLLLTLAVMVAGAVASVQSQLLANLSENASQIDIAIFRVFTGSHLPSSRLIQVAAAGQLIAFLAIGLLIVWRRSNDWLVLLTSAMLITIGVGFSPSVFFLPVLWPSWTLPVVVLQVVLFTSVVVFLLIFPDGQVVPRWARLIAVGWALYALTWFAFPELNPHYATSPVALFIFITMVMGSLTSQVYRYRTVSNAIERQQTKWVVVGFLSTNVCFFILVTLGVTGITPRLEAVAPLPTKVIGTLLALSSVLIPITIGIAISRYHLWDIDRLVNRALVYGALTAAIIGLYVILVGGLGLLFQTSGGLILPILATVLIAILFNPVRLRLQQAVNRLMYGDRDDPLTIVARLGQQLENTAATADLLPRLVETIAAVLKLPYVAVATGGSGDAEIIAQTGTPTVDLHAVPLIFQSVKVGTLLVAPRSPQEPFTPAELHLLNTIAHQAGAAVSTAQLSTSLQHSRERLILAQEEERQRIQRDLHDGLGPQLAALGMRLQVAQRLIADDPEAASRLLDELQGESQAAIAGIRRLVYGLRPPVLDQLGLASALHEFAAANQVPHGPRITVNIASDLPALQAALETAVYRIATEAVANCVNHSGASQCQVSLRVDEGLNLVVRDDGGGLPDPVTPGVGLTSMRSRVTELGGRIFISRPAAGNGTIVNVSLPLPGENPT